MAIVDASPSRERLDRVVEMLRGVEESAVRRPVRRGPRPRRRPTALPSARESRGAQPEA